MKPLLKAAVLLLVASGTVHAQEQYPQPTPAMQAIVDKDVKRKFGDAPADPGPVATDLSAALTKKDIDKVLRKVADWQLARTMAYTDQIWTASVAYAGFMAASEATGDPKYRNAMAKLGKGFNWSLRGAAYPNADDISIGQMYLELYLKEPRPEKIATLRQHLDTLVDLDTLRPGDARLPWWWCDALFMAPPVWLKMWQATGERKYLDYVHEQWKKTYDLLYDQEEHLYARDAGYKDKREGNGKKVFWSRGEGWVMGGLARTLEILPKDDPQRPFYVQQLREMSAKLASLQDANGEWHAGLLDPQAWPLAETSGAALFVYGMAYGVNNGYLDEKTYRPVIEKAWAGLLKHIYADGRLGGIQQTGAEPAYYQPSSSYNYGVGGFMLAAAELKKMAVR
ncbi:rhamnogalacturonyl hydrolase YesR [Pseudoduganella flava]|uniref:Glycoside hydrolase family 88 protein n=1 Tax=Pseudoduganella flava TaxID=871742 RepID=A0A562Q401_9BURK|nr:glycoside hydrolase family 88 protein [Pseudoduganella flava]QGZ41498.1 glycoside hydrolase family 88 protein [Pseudoduganella flava]TWI51462.1 rhamnogalacturonyl hydrolase YesR [Pseudoduganella flava]